MSRTAETHDSEDRKLNCEVGKQQVGIEEEEKKKKCSYTLLLLLCFSVRVSNFLDLLLSVW